MATPEGKVKDGVKMVLAKYKVYYHCPVQNGMGAPSLDFIGCHVGHYFGIETKAPGKRPTPRQLITMANITRCGGKTFVIDGTNKTDTFNDLEAWVRDLIKEWLEEIGELACGKIIESISVPKASDTIIKVAP